MRPRRRFHSRRTLLVGDAAGFVNPITGEGMSYAFTSANLAADSVAGLLCGGQDLSSYARGCRKEILNDLNAATFFGPSMYWLAERLNVAACFDKLEGDETVMDAIGGIARGESEWRLLFRRLMVRMPKLLLDRRVIQGRSGAPHMPALPPLSP